MFDCDPSIKGGLGFHYHNVVTAMGARSPRAKAFFFSFCELVAESFRARRGPWLGDELSVAV